MTTSNMLYKKWYDGFEDENGTESGKVVATLVRHDRELVAGYTLRESLFDINSPFYMDTEWPQVEGDCATKADGRKRRIRKKKRNIYEEQLDVNYRNLIERFLAHLQADHGHLLPDEKSISGFNDRNKLAREAAHSIEAARCIIASTASSGIQCNQGPATVAVSEHLIPGNSSFELCDVLSGLSSLYELIVMKRKEVDIGTEFSLIMDPPWQSKSLKRKHCYETREIVDIIKIVEPCKRILELVANVQLSRFGSASISVAIWTTNKFRAFCEDELLKGLNCKLTGRLLWHKITKSGKGAKIRGSPEYLIVGKWISENQLPLVNFEPAISGVLVSIPSAIHSHKPPINVRELFEPQDAKLVVSSDGEVNSNCSKKSDSMNCAALHGGCLPSPFNGVELFARYLRPSYHSFGFEGIKLQAEILYDKF